VISTDYLVTGVEILLERVGTTVGVFVPGTAFSVVSNANVGVSMGV
jgi:hypothetical protein